MVLAFFTLNLLGSTAILLVSQVLEIHELQEMGRRLQTDIAQYSEHLCEEPEGVGEDVTDVEGMLTGIQDLEQEELKLASEVADFNGRVQVVIESQPQAAREVSSPFILLEVLNAKHPFSV